MAQPDPNKDDFLTEDVLVVGEFCEKRGPTPVLFHYDPLGTNRQLHHEIEPYCNAFMMRAMSGDHSYGDQNNANSQLKHRPCEVLLDNVGWYDPKTSMTAFVYVFSMPDVYARGYTRTACLAYLTPDEHKMHAIVNWLSREFQFAAEGLFDAMLAKHKAEMKDAIAAVEMCTQFENIRSQLSERNQSSLDSERESLKRRSQRPPLCGLGVAEGPPAPVPSSKNKRTTKTAMAMMMQQDGGDAGAQPPAQLLKSPSVPSMEGGPSQGSELSSSQQQSPDSPGTTALPSHSDPNATFPSSSASSPMLGSNGSGTHSGIAASSAFGSMTPEDAQDIVDRLITKKGTIELRGLDEMCPKAFLYVDRRLTMCIRLFSQETVWVQETTMRLMRNTPLLMEGSITDWFTDNPSPLAEGPSASPSPVKFFFKIGDFITIDPSLADATAELREDTGVPCFEDRVCKVTMLNSENIYRELRRRPDRVILNIAYNALRCSPIIVCADSREQVEDAMHVASTFVPAFRQARPFGVAIMGFDGQVPQKAVKITVSHITQYAIIGCPKSAILEGKDGSTVSRLPQAAVWEVRINAKKGDHEDVVHGRQYDLNYKKKTVNQGAFAPTTQVPTDPTALPSASLYNSGLLTELHEVLNLRASVNQTEAKALAHYLRLVLSRTFLEYGTMAALALQTLGHPPAQMMDASGRERTESVHTNDAPGSSRSIQLAKASPPLPPQPGGHVPPLDGSNDSARHSPDNTASNESSPQQAMDVPKVTVTASGPQSVGTSSGFPSTHIGGSTNTLDALQNNSFSTDPTSGYLAPTSGQQVAANMRARRTHKHLLTEADVRQVLENELGYPGGLHPGDVGIVTHMMRRMLFAWCCHEQQGDKTGVTPIPPPQYVE